ncbi:MAG TPA: sodium:proton antiporter NhaD [Candidatus Azoamicus sp. MARI]
MKFKHILLFFFILLSLFILPYYCNIISSIEIKAVITICFIICYIFVILEEIIHIKKSVITIFFSSVMLLLLMLSKSVSHIYVNSILNNFLHVYCELFFFLFVAMIYINILKNLFLFDFIKNKIVSKKISLKKIYIFTGVLSFLISPFADNLTTALIMSSIILHINNDNKSFVNLSFINVVVASNAGGVFSPFGDITTLMIWQSGMIKFSSFFYLFFPSLISFIIPSIIMSFFIRDVNSNVDVKIFVSYETSLSFDAKVVLSLFFLTILSAVFFQAYLNISSVFGMMFGFSFLQIFLFLKNKNNFTLSSQVINIEWETLLFFYGIMLCVSALDICGILKDLSYFLYNDFVFSSLYDKTFANIFLGLISSIVDNIPITFIVLNMKISMSDGQWLLLTYTLATGGSLLSIGSAAGIALMGNKHYTFYSHFKWSWAILIGYFLGAFTHIIINKHFF